MPRVHITDEYALVKRKGSERWYLEWRERGQKVRRATGAISIEQARERARELILAGVEIRDAAPSSIGLLDVLDRYRLQRGDKLPSKGMVKRACALWREFWGDASVADTSVAQQEAFATWLRERELSEGYVRRVLGVGKAALNRAWKRGEVQQVPFVDLPPIGEGYPHYASRAQLVTLLNSAMPAHIWTYCLIRLTTGCRGDAARDLQPHQIDTSARLIRLNPPGRIQTKKYRPVVPLTDVLAAHLRTLACDTHYVHWHGQYVASIKTTWRKLRIALGLPAWFAPKVLRHTVATELRRRGVPGWEVSGLVGHHKGTTEIYAKFDPAYLGKARKAIDAWMRDLARDVPKLRGVIAGSVPCEVNPTIPMKPLSGLVGAPGIEPGTPTMSRSRNLRKIKT